MQIFRQWKYLIIGCNPTNQALKHALNSKGLFTDLDSLPKGVKVPLLDHFPVLETFCYDRILPGQLVVPKHMLSDGGSLAIPVTPGMPHIISTVEKPQ